MGGVGGGGKDRYRHTIAAKYASKQRNLPHACRTKDNLDNAGNNAATSVETRMTCKKFTKCRKAVAVSSTLCSVQPHGIHGIIYFISLFAYC